MTLVIMVTCASLIHTSGPFASLRLRSCCTLIYFFSLTRLSLAKESQLQTRSLKRWEMYIVHLRVLCESSRASGDYDELQFVPNHHCSVRESAKAIEMEARHVPHPGDSPRAECGANYAASCTSFRFTDTSSKWLADNNDKIENLTDS